LTLQVWIQNCSDGELLAYKTQQIVGAGFEKNIQQGNEESTEKRLTTKNLSGSFHKGQVLNVSPPISDA
jgi:hypothetical protein